MGYFTNFNILMTIHPNNLGKVNWTKTQFKLKVQHKNYQAFITHPKPKQATCYKNNFPTKADLTNLATTYTILSTPDQVNLQCTAKCWPRQTFSKFTKPRSRYVQITNFLGIAQVQRFDRVTTCLLAHRDQPVETASWLHMLTINKLLIEFTKEKLHTQQIAPSYNTYTTN